MINIAYLFKLFLCVKISEGNLRELKQRIARKRREVLFEEILLSSVFRNLHCQQVDIKHKTRNTGYLIDLTFLQND